MYARLFSLGCWEQFSDHANLCTLSNNEITCIIAHEMREKKTNRFQIFLVVITSIRMRSSVISTCFPLQACCPVFASMSLIGPYFPNRTWSETLHNPGLPAQHGRCRQCAEQPIGPFSGSTAHSGRTRGGKKILSYSIEPRQTRIGALAEQS